MKNSERLRYPIGKYKAPKRFVPELKQGWITAIDKLPGWIKDCVENIDANGLDMPYREDGWTIKQVVHHLADVHVNAYIRLKCALTESNPAVNPYNEEIWAMFPDAMQAPVGDSIALLYGLHHRWAETLRNMKDSDWMRTYFHLGQNINVEVWKMISLYAWHGSHHAAQIRQFYLYKYSKNNRAGKSKKGYDDNEY